MVRIKNRYLVVNYLYPTTSTTSKSNDSLPDFIQFHQPTPDQFHVGLLLKAIRDGVTELFGEYGMGMISANMKGIQSFSIFRDKYALVLTPPQ